MTPATLQIYTTTITLLGSLPFKYKVVIAGNHDLCFDPNVVQGKNGKSDAMKALLTNCIYLEDSSVTIYGIKIYGSPYQPEFGDMDAFTLKKGTKVRLKIENNLENTKHLNLLQF